MADYSPTKYQEEKLNGDRLPSGAAPLKKLSPTHRQILMLHMAGISGNDIAEELGLKLITISRVLNDPLGQAEISRAMKTAEREFDALMPKTVEVLRDGMNASSAIQRKDGTTENRPQHGTRLKATDIYFKASGRYNNDSGGGETAEDVIERMLKNPLVNVTINNDVTGGTTDAKAAVGRTFEGELDGDS